MKTFKVGLLLVTLCVFAIQFAQAQEQKKEQNPEERFEKIDTNSDGLIDKLEFKTKMDRKNIKDGKVIDIEKMFAKKDKNADGFIDLEEFKAKGQKKNKE